VALAGIRRAERKEKPLLGDSRSNAASASETSRTVSKEAFSEVGQEIKKDSPFKGCASSRNLSYLVPLCNVAGLPLGYRPYGKEVFS
jgi:hypothetical protein